MRLHLPDNVKIHFAGAETRGDYVAVERLGVQYSLFTCYPWVEKQVFSRNTSALATAESAKVVPQELASTFSHVIQDSGLFTLMFGAQKSIPKDYKLISRWYDGLVEYTLNHAAPVTCVEVDCQRVLGVEAAWEFRERMRRDLPNNRIINVFHLPDGQKGLDRLIEFSEYIAISVPELRFAGRKEYVPKIARYIKKRKPEIDIHLLGCTEIDLLKKCKFCSSADSTSWKSGVRYGFLNGKHVSTLNCDRVANLVGADNWAAICDGRRPEYMAALVAFIEKLKYQYEKAAGNQDYYKHH